jgi:hypothetical protein
MGLKIVNQAYGILASGITSGATTIPLQTGHGARFGSLAAGEFLLLTLINGANQLEVTKITGIAGDNLTAVRGQDGTTAIAFSAGDRIECRPCRAAMLEFLLKSDFGSYAATLGLVPTTGDVKPTFKAVADATWVMMDDGTIGAAASGATTRANADTEALFTLLWNNIINTWAPVSGGRGASAAADFAANKTLTLPKALGRALAVGGAGAGLTARALGENLGTESIAGGVSGDHTLTIAEIPAHTHANVTHLSSAGGGTIAAAHDTSDITGVTISASTGGGGSHSHTTPAHGLMQPTSFMNVMVKL